MGLGRGDVRLSDRTRAHLMGKTRQRANRLAYLVESGPGFTESGQQALAERAAAEITLQFQVLGAGDVAVRFVPATRDFIHLTKTVSGHVYLENPETGARRPLRPGDLAAPKYGSLLMASEQSRGALLAMDHDAEALRREYGEPRTFGEAYTALLKAYTKHDSFSGEVDALREVSTGRLMVGGFPVKYVVPKGTLLGGASFFKTLALLGQSHAAKRRGYWRQALVPVFRGSDNQLDLESYGVLVKLRSQQPTTGQCEQPGCASGDARMPALLSGQSPEGGMSAQRIMSRAGGPGTQQGTCLSAVTDSRGRVQCIQNVQGPWVLCSGANQGQGQCVCLGNVFEQGPEPLCSTVWVSGGYWEAMLDLLRRVRW